MADIVDIGNDDDDLFELLLISNILQCFLFVTKSYAEVFRVLLQQQVVNDRMLNRSLPVRLVRPTWEAFTSRIGEKIFRKMFRMSHTTFARLCNKIATVVTPKVFKSEFLVDPLLELPTLALDAIGGFIPGELKLAILLRLLAGACYIDMIALFHVSETSVWNVFHEAITWVRQTFTFPLRELLEKKDWPALKVIAAEFGARTEGTYNGCFGAIDGIAIRVKCFSTNDVPDPGNYYCRKGFYALNVQAICDRRKRFLWCSTGHKGGTHDSRAFSETNLYELLDKLAEDLKREGLYLAGDSAYALAVFLLTPFDNPEAKSMQDAFNFYHSSSRIFIECSFGELVMRWGIFWRRLCFGVSKVGHIIQSAMLLHNFIVDERETAAGQVDNHFFENFEYDESRSTAASHSEPPEALVTDNDEPKPAGRPDKRKDDLKKLGEELRTTLTVNLAARAYVRPQQAGMTYNKHGHVYMTY
jgi:DDE superfamily endonuclease